MPHRSAAPPPAGVQAGFGAGDPALWTVAAALAAPDYLLVRLLATPTNHRAPPLLVRSHDLRFGCSDAERSLSMPPLRGRFSGS